MYPLVPVVLESLLTAKLVDDITNTRSDKTRESWGQGAANILSGLFGSRGGCAMIGQTMINVKVSGARTRISESCRALVVVVESCLEDDEVVLNDTVGLSLVPSAVERFGRP